MYHSLLWSRSGQSIPRLVRWINFRYGPFRALWYFQPISPAPGQAGRGQRCHRRETDLSSWLVGSSLRGREQDAFDSTDHAVSHHLVNGAR